MFRCRINRSLIRQAKRVAKEIGTTPGEIVRLLFKQLVKRRTIPFPLHADAPEDEILSPARRRARMWDEFQQKAGKLGNENDESAMRLGYGCMAAAAIPVAIILAKSANWIY